MQACYSCEKHSMEAFLEFCKETIILEFFCKKKDIRIRIHAY